MKENSPDKWQKLAKEVQIYELKLPSNLEKLSRGKSFSWKRTTKKATYYETETKAEILETTAVWVNPKNTIKVALLGQNRDFVCFSRNHSAGGWLTLHFDPYDEEPSDIFDNLQKGTWVITSQKYSSSGRTIAFISNEKTLSRVKSLLETLHYLWRTENKYQDFVWKVKFKVESYGTVGLKEVLAQKDVIDRKLRHFRWIRRKERWDLWNAVKANLSFKKTKKELKVKVKALDGHSYFLESPLIKELHLGWKEVSCFKVDFWVPFVYRKPKDAFLQLPKDAQTKELLDKFSRIINRLPKTSLTLGRDGKRVRIQRKETKNGALLNYLNGLLVKKNEIRKRLLDYWLNSIPLLKKVSKSSKAQKGRTLSLEAQLLTKRGLNGTMRDLEGSLPFHLNIIYKKKENKWYIEIAGKEFYVKGGCGALRKISTAIKGTAIVDREKYSWSDKQGTRLIRDRLGELVGEENALWIILKAKQMGALMKAISSK